MPLSIVQRRANVSQAVLQTMLRIAERTAFSIATANRLEVILLFFRLSLVSKPHPKFLGAVLAVFTVTVAAIAGAV